MENNLTPEDKKAFRLFGIESVIIILLIIVILVVLSMLNVIPLRSFIPGLSGIRPTGTVKDVENQALVEQYRKAPASISAVSDIPGYTVSVNNEEELIRILKSWGVYGKSYGASSFASGSTGAVPLKKIVLHMTDKVQQANKYSTDGTNKTVYSSSYGNFSPGQLDVYIQVDLSKKDVLPRQIMLQLIKFIGVVNSPAKTSADLAAVQDVIDTRFDGLADSSADYFKISEK